MLVLTRKVDQSFFVGDDVKITIVRVAQGGVRVGIEAPDGVRILRTELVDRNPTPNPKSKIQNPKLEGVAA